MRLSREGGGVRLAAVLLLAAGPAAAPAAGPAGQDAGDGGRTVRLESLDVSDNLYLLRGGGTNVLALVTGGGVVLVDTMGPGWGAPIRAALDNLTDRPVTMIVNTHAHERHVGGNPEFPHAAEILAHENTKARMERMAAFAGANARFLPNRTFRDTTAALDGFDRIELHHFGAAHTDGDTVVVFPEKGIAYLGDLFAARAAPRIDRSAGGSGLGFPDVLAAARDRLRFFTEFERGPEIRTFDRVTPGHEEPPDQTPLLFWLTWADLERYAAFTRGFVDAVVRARSAGRSVDDAAAEAAALADDHPGYAPDGARPAVEAIFDELAAAGR